MPELPSDTLQFVPPIKDWAAARSDIREVWIIGSRSRGDHRPDSDLDLVLKTNLDGPTAYNLFFWEHERLASELSTLLRVRVHVCQGDDDYTTEEVAAGLACNGVRIFSEKEQR